MLTKLEIDTYIQLKKKLIHKQDMYDAHKKDFENKSTTLTSSQLASKLRSINSLKLQLENTLYHKEVEKEITALLVKRDHLKGGEKQAITKQITKLRNNLIINKGGNDE